ncbi:unnamed protein product [Bubo scandiacus]
MKNTSLLKGDKTAIFDQFEAKVHVSAELHKSWGLGAVDVNSLHELDPTPGHVSRHMAAALGPRTEMVHDHHITFCHHFDDNTINANCQWTVLCSPHTAAQLG